MCDDKEGNSVLIEKLIKILFIIVIYHKQQFKTKDIFKYFNFLCNALKYWEEIRFLFLVQTQVCLFFCHRFKVFLSSCGKHPVVKEKETESVVTSNSLPSLAQNSNVKGRSQSGGSKKCAHQHTCTYIHIQDNASCTSRCLHPKQPVCPSQAA